MSNQRAGWWIAVSALTVLLPLPETLTATSTAPSLVLTIPGLQLPLQPTRFPPIAC